MMRVVVNGWRLIAHSYALACQQTCLSLLRRPDIELRFREQPLYQPDWVRREGILRSEDEARLANIAAPGAGEDCDIEYRMDFPLDLRAPARGTALVFATAENGALLRPMRHAGTAADSAAGAKTGIVTPARWNVDAFLRIGIPLDRIFVVPLGFDPGLYLPQPGIRERMRAELKLDGVVMLSVGAMTGNKGIGLLVEAFARLVQARPQACLLLKGADALYGSKDLLQKCIDLLPSRLRELVLARLVYVGETLSSEQMAGLYQAADCYVAPYSAEGFVMPALEAAACGLPVICTRGGPTDDFLRDEFTKKIDSRLIIGPAAEEAGTIVKTLAPDAEHLVDLMGSAIDDEGWRQRAGAAGAAHVHAHFTWDRVTDRLVDAFKRSACQAT